MPEEWLGGFDASWLISLDKTGIAITKLKQASISKKPNFFSIVTSECWKLYEQGVRFGRGP